MYDCASVWLKVHWVKKFQIPGSLSSAVYLPTLLVIHFSLFFLTEPFEKTKNT